VFVAADGFLWGEAGGVGESAEGVAWCCCWKSEECGWWCFSRLVGVGGYQPVFGKLAA